MQIAETPVARSPVTVVGPSLALELSWATHSAWSPRLRAQHPILEELALTKPELLDQVRGFWDDGGDCFAEMEVLAYLGGALEVVEFDPLFDAMDSARGRIPPDLPLRSETPGARDTIHSRLDQLKGDDHLWRRYRALFAAIYGPLDEWWSTTGGPTAERAVAATRRALDRGGEWRRMVSTDCVEISTRIAEMPDQPGPIVLAPCALFGKGLYLDLPGCQLIGVGAGMGEFGARTRTDEVARAIRVLADPTRLAILDHLRSGERSISDLALDFGLSQPTISVHVKQLRQAGLVIATRQGSRLELAVDTDAVKSLAHRLTALVEH
jgi:DNA-binding transcriptional ArsR family regulator